MADKVWKFLKTIIGSEDATVHGIDIFTVKWISTGEKINVKDPLYGQPYTFEVVEVSKNSVKIKFAAGEFSNNCWGVYIPVEI